MGLQLGYILSLGPLLPLSNFELHVIAFLKALVAFTLDGAVVDEHIGPVISANKAEALCIIKPFHFTFDSHVSCSTDRARGCLPNPLSLVLGILPLLEGGTQDAGGNITPA